MFMMAMAAASALSSALSIGGKNEELARQQKNIRKQQDSVLAGQRSQYDQSRFQQESIANQTAEQLTKLDRQSQAEESSIVAQQASSGLSGAGAMRQRANVFMQEAMTAGSVKEQGSKALTQSGFQDIATAINTQSNINQLQSSSNELESQKTTGLDSALQIGQSALKGYTGAGGTF